MRNIFTFCLVFCGLTVFSQDVSKTLQANKWYTKYDTETMKLIYSKKPVSKGDGTMEFKENGKIVWCGIIEEGTLDANGVEAQSTHSECDSIRKYEVKNGKLMTQIRKETPEYFKLHMKGEIIELTPIKAEEYK